MATGKTVKLLSGFDCPLLGYGTYQSTDTEQLKSGIKAAIEAGYRHIDTAHIYGNEQIIGEVLQELYDVKIVKREDIFITTKLFGCFFRPQLVEPILKKQLAKLRTSYVDLYLMHMPVALKELPNNAEFPTSFTDLEVDNTIRTTDTWPAMEQCVGAGLARSIGISNFTITDIERILKMCTIKPAVNQIEVHPVFQNKKLIEFCKSQGIVVTAYSQFGRPNSVSPITGKPFYEGSLLDDERLVAIAKRHGKNAAQVILRWLAQQSIVSIPKSVTPSRIASNFEIWDFQLTDEDMKAIGAMDSNHRLSWFPLPGLEQHPDYTFAADGSSC